MTTQDEKKLEHFILFANRLKDWIKREKAAGLPTRKSEQLLVFIRERYQKLTDPNFDSAELKEHGYHPRYTLEKVVENGEVKFVQKPIEKKNPASK